MSSPVSLFGAGNHRPRPRRWSLSSADRACGQGGLARLGDFADQRLQRLARARAGNAHHRDRRRRAAGGEGEDGVAAHRHDRVEANRGLPVKAKRIRLHVTIWKLDHEAQATGGLPRRREPKTAGRKASKPKSPPAKPSRAKPSRDKVRAHRARMRKRGFRLVQMWLPDTRTKEFAAQAHKDSLAIANSPTEAEDQAFVDSVSWWNSPEARDLEKREPPTPGGAPTGNPIEARGNLDHCRRRPITPASPGPQSFFKATNLTPLHRSLFVCSPARPFDNVYARFTVAPSEANGLESSFRMSWSTRFPRSQEPTVGRRIGQLDGADLGLLNQRVILFLGLAG